MEHTEQQDKNTKRRILHITMGDDNWCPTQQELENIVECFKTAEFAGTDETTIVATRHAIDVEGSIQARIVWVDENTTFVPVSRVLNDDC